MSRTPQRPSIIRPAPGRYVNVGIEEGFRSSSSLARLAVLFLRTLDELRAATDERGKSKTAITDLNRIILSSHFGDYGSPNIVSQKGKDEPGAAGTSGKSFKSRRDLSRMENTAQLLAIAAVVVFATVT